VDPRTRFGSRGRPGPPAGIDPAESIARRGAGRSSKHTCLPQAAWLSVIFSGAPLAPAISFLISKDKRGAEPGTPGPGRIRRALGSSARWLWGGSAPRIPNRHIPVPCRNAGAVITALLLRVWPRVDLRGTGACGEPQGSRIRAARRAVPGWRTFRRTGGHLRTLPYYFPT